MTFKTTAEIRTLFINYFNDHAHTHISSSSLIPTNDETLLFTNAGMVQFKNNLLGIGYCDYKKAVTCQKCLRAGGKHNDLENVGFTARHHTFFEMLGNFSFGDYFKEQAIFFAWDFLTNYLHIPKDKLLVTIYHTDDEAYNIWKKVSNLPDEKIIRIATKDNFWEMGDTGPCGPCSEIFYDHGSHIEGGVPGSDNEDGDRYVEIWNLVFVEYNKLKNGTLASLNQKCIDTGMGLERISAIMQGVNDNYDIDLFKAIMTEVEKITGIKLSTENKHSFKVISDHIRSSVFLILDGIIPSNEGRGYILRRIIRRAVRHFYLLGSKQANLYKLVDIICYLMGPAYPEIIKREDYIKDIIKSEEEKFSNTFENGLKMLNAEVEKLKPGGTLSGKVAFRLYETFGFPVDLTEDFIKQYKITIDYAEFEAAAVHHKNLAKNSWTGSSSNKDKVWFDLEANNITTEFIGYDYLSSNSQVVSLVKKDGTNLISVSKLEKGDAGYILLNKTPFYPEKGGQIGDQGKIFINNVLIAEINCTRNKGKNLIVHEVSEVFSQIELNAICNAQVDTVFREQVTKNHTATHLLYEALGEVLGSTAMQQGSLMTNNAIRLDISNNKPISKEELQKIEDIVNDKILANMQVDIASMKYEDAIEQGALGLFTEKYPKIVRTVKIFDKDSNTPYSFALCAGTHVKQTGEIGLFKILHECSVAGGVRRIEAITGKKVLELLNSHENKLLEIKSSLNIHDNNLILDRITSLFNENKNLKDSLQKIKLSTYLDILEKQTVSVSDVKVNISYINDTLLSNKDIQKLVQKILNKEKSIVIIVLLALSENKVSIIASQKGIKLNLSDILRKTTNSSGGGNANFYQGSAKLHHEESLHIIEKIKKEINEIL